MRGCFGSLTAAIRSLKEHVPPNHPVVVKLCELPRREAGDCNLVDNKYIIRINRDLDETARVLMLVHEWAHSLTWKHPVHGRKWAMAYRRCYRVIGSDKRCGRGRIPTAPT
jgi:hypothetical protein